jgi:hypothetical protein
METQMRKLVLLVSIMMVALTLLSWTSATAGVIPSWESPSGKLGFFPISNELSLYKNYDDSGEDRGETLQIIMINSFKLGTTFNFEFTADYNFDMAPGLSNDHYVELSIVKPITPMFSLNIQRIMATFEPESINQFGFRLSF